MKNWLRILPLIFCVALLALLYDRLGKNDGVLPSAMISRPVPQFVLPPLLSGQADFSSDDLKGQISIVNIFASWCVPCQLEHPFLQNLSKKVKLYGIDYRDKKDAAIAMLARLGNPYEKIGIDTEGRAVIDWGTYGVPETYVISPVGIILYRHVGPLDNKIIKQDIEPIINSLQ